MTLPEGHFGVVPIEQARTMDGMTLFREIMAGRLPAPWEHLPPSSRSVCHRVLAGPSSG